MEVVGRGRLLFQTAGGPQLFSHQVRIDRDIPCFAAITLVAPGVRFSFLAILATPCLSLAIDFINRRSSFDHASLTILFFFFANSIAPFFRSGLLASNEMIARRNDVTRTLYISKQGFSMPFGDNPFSSDSRITIGNR